MSKPMCWPEPISTADQMPNVTEPHLAWNPKYNNWMRHGAPDTGRCTCRPDTHPFWLPLPPPPKEPWEKAWEARFSDLNIVDTAKAGFRAGYEAAQKAKV